MTPQRKRVRDGLHGSSKDLFPQTVTKRFLPGLRHETVPPKLSEPPPQLRLQRAIGVNYRPETERQSHYFYTRLAGQFDAMIHIDETSALERLDKGPVWDAGEMPETFPSGIKPGSKPFRRQPAALARSAAERPALPRGRWRSRPSTGSHRWALPSRAFLRRKTPAG